MPRYPPIHAGRLERWLGVEAVTRISDSMRHWHGREGIPLQIPRSRVWAMPGGDFQGQLEVGRFASFRDFALERVKRAIRIASRRHLATAHTGFASLSDLISEATTGGKQQAVWLHKTGLIFTPTNMCASLWKGAGKPQPGGTTTAIPGGEAPTNATVGGFLQTNAVGLDTLHIVSALLQCNTTSQTILVYDRLFHAGSVLHTTTANQAITGVPTRYNLQTSSINNFCFLELTTGNGATAQNVTLTFTDNFEQVGAGNACVITPSMAAGAIPLAGSSWFYPLNRAPDDYGLINVTNVAFSASNVAGVSTLVIGHPLVFLTTFQTAGVPLFFGGIDGLFNLVRVQDYACLAMLELRSVASAAVPTYTGQVVMVSG